MWYVWIFCAISFDRSLHSVIHATLHRYGVLNFSISLCLSRHLIIRSITTQAIAVVSICSIHKLHRSSSICYGFGTAKWINRISFHCTSQFAIRSTKSCYCAPIDKLLRNMHYSRLPKWSERERENNKNVLASRHFRQTEWVQFILSRLLLANTCFSRNESMNEKETERESRKIYSKKPFCFYFCQFFDSSSFHFSIIVVGCGERNEKLSNHDFMLVTHTHTLSDEIIDATLESIDV